jgi:hypothetical protein
MTPEPRGEMKETLQRTPACIRIERFGEDLTQAERDHLSACARCQTELALWQEFTQSIPARDEGAAVQWIAAEVRRRRAELRPSRKFVWARDWLGPLRSPGFAAAAAALVLSIGIGHLAWDREPSITTTPGDLNYRTASLGVVAPVGDLPSPPRELVWMAAPGAMRYDVEVLEIDRTILWRASSTALRVDLPAAVVAQLVPGKPVLWEVTALDGSGTVLAQSGTQRFRVRVKASTRRD